MPVSRALRRLLRIRELEEEQSRLALESGLGELHRAERALAAAAEQDRRGRHLVEASARSGELRDRLAGMEETRVAGRLAKILEPILAGCRNEAERLRELYLAKRVERRQAETLIQEAEAEDALESVRRGQQVLDDWYSSKRHRIRLQPEPSPTSDKENEDFLNQQEGENT